MSIAKLLAITTEKGLVIATAESCTGGLIAGALTDLPGSSAMFDRGFVTYSNAAKTEVLGVDPIVITDHGAVSEEVAAAMARGALNRSNAAITVSVTGVAGPGGTAAKPEGMVCFGLATAIGIKTETQQFGALGRDRIRAETVRHAVEMLLTAVIHEVTRK